MSNTIYLKNGELITENEINICEVLPDKVLFPIITQIWEALEKEGINTSDDAELEIKVYD
tara:strand:- start:767 stop:946 length:180 start_codon:yes stop_codon:yes gene_type:complete